jgi:hypothetical protein
MIHDKVCDYADRQEVQWPASQEALFVPATHVLVGYLCLSQHAGLGG